MLGVHSAYKNKGHDYPKYCPNPQIRKLTKFLPMFLPLRGCR